MTTKADQKDKTGKDLEQDDGDVLTTVFNFDQFRITKITDRRITLLQASGSYSPALGKELERLSAQARNALGIDLSGVNQLHSSILASLKNIQKKLSVRRREFYISNPSERLLDLLKLNDLVSHFKILDTAPGGRAPAARPSSAAAPPPAKEEAKSGAAEAEKQITHLTRSLRRTEVLEKEMDSASKCVRRFLPSKPPVFPGYDFAFSTTPCDKVGGDFFDFVPLGQRFLGISIGDVSGHGLDSAIIMGMAKKVIRLRAREYASGSPADVLRQVNTDIFEDLGRRLFITVLYARLDMERGVLQYARAGHEPPLHFAPGSGAKVEMPESTGLALGMDPGPVFKRILEEKEVAIRPGEGLLLYTDGLVESWNPRHDMFSRERLRYLLENLPQAQRANDVLDRINTTIAQFSEGLPPEDDMTAIVIMRQ